MATIHAKGKTDYGEVDVIIKDGVGKPQVICDDEFIKEMIREGIENAEGWIANAYHPPKNTMLQAYCYLFKLFDYDDISVDGEIGEIPHKPGVIY